MRLKIPLIVASLYPALCFVACLSQRALLYPAPVHRAVDRLPSGLIEVTGDVAGHGTYALCALPSTPDAPVIVHFHGNGEAAIHSADRALAAQRAGLGFCAIEYPGYGPLSAQSMSETLAYSLAEATLAQLSRDHQVRPDRVVLSGQSLGTGIAVEMARRGLGARMVLLSPYTSMVDVVQRIAVVLPATLLVRDRYNTQQKATSISMHTLIIHGSEDTLIPVEMGRGLQRLFRNSQLIEVQGRGHNDLFAHAEDHVWESILAFARGQWPVPHPARAH
ncbi:MAG: alpha/beta hydrolase [Deltaproteobacteria bacterium]|nr:alpha/beta hydrolase [Deltaproteobacteria bacterium]